MFCKVIKLSNGETIIGSIIKEERNYVVVERPIKSEIVPTTRGLFRVMLIKWDPTMDFNSPVKIFKENIVSVGDPTQEFLDSYMEVYNDRVSNKEDMERESLDEVSDDLGKIEDLLKMLSAPGANTTIH